MVKSVLNCRSYPKNETVCLFLDHAVHSKILIKHFGEFSRLPVDSLSLRVAWFVSELSGYTESRIIDWVDDPVFICGPVRLLLLLLTRMTYSCCSVATAIWPKTDCMRGGQVHVVFPLNGSIVLYIGMKNTGFASYASHTLALVTSIAFAHVIYFDRDVCHSNWIQPDYMYNAEKIEWRMPDIGPALVARQKALPYD